jgi:hypothetical protein
VRHHGLPATPARFVCLFASMGFHLNFHLSLDSYDACQVWLPVSLSSG